MDRDTGDAGAAAVTGDQDVDISLDLLVWRSALSRGAIDPDVAEQLRFARLCREAGAESAARMVYQAACLHLGFAPGSVARRGGETLAGPWEALTRDDARGMVARALDDLRVFARDHAAALATGLRAARESDSAASAALTQDTAFPGVALPALLEDLFAFLSAEPRDDGQAQDGFPFARIRQIASRIDPIDCRSFASAPLPLLAAAIALASLQAFCVRNSALILPPFGSAAVLYAAARFDEDGLGPYFANVPRIARKSQDIFELAQIAQSASTAEAGSITREQWVALLVTPVSGGLRDEVVDDLGDLGATSALSMILDTAMHQPTHHIDSSLIMRIRDAGLDNADYTLGARAQALLARIFPDQLLERRLLGEIYATAGLTRVAEQVFLHCLEDSPGDTLLQDRIAALHAGRSGEYAILHGFGTPPDRLHNRRLRRERAAQAA